MRLTTKEFLYSLLWGADKLARPSYSKIFESFEGWAYRNGVLHHLRDLERRKLIERLPNARRGRRSGVAERIVRLTEVGRLVAIGGKDPEICWNRGWDGKWRLIVFDLPEKERKARVRLRYHLRTRGFGYLQNSGWLSPDPVDDAIKSLSGAGEDVESFLLFAGRPEGGESDESIVAGAWDFERIERRCQKCLDLLEKLPRGDFKNPRHLEKLRQWGRQERLAWDALVEVDPFLPKKLLPKGYLGIEVWRRRNVALRNAGQGLS